MRKKIGKRIGPVPITLVSVFALAAFISVGLLLAVNSGQMVAAQASADCTIGATATEDMGLDAAGNCSVPGTEANIKFEGVLPTVSDAGSTNFFVYGTNVGEGSEGSSIYPENTRYHASTADPAPTMVSCNVQDEEGTTVQVEVDGTNEDVTKMVPHMSYVDRDCNEVDALRGKTITVDAPGNNANSEILTITGDELTQATLYVFRARPAVSTTESVTAVGANVPAGVFGVDPDLTNAGFVNVTVKFLGPPSAAKECGDESNMACSTLMANRGDPVRSNTRTTNLVLTVMDENGDLLEGFAQLSLMDAGSAVFTETNRTTETVKVEAGMAEVTVEGLPSTGAFKYAAMADFEASNGTLTVKTSITRLGDAEMIEADAYMCTPEGKGDIEEVIGVEADDAATPPVEAVAAVAANECVSEINGLKSSSTGDDPDPLVSIAPGGIFTIYGKATDSAGNKVSSLEWEAAEDDEDVFTPSQGDAETKITVGAKVEPGSYELTINDARDDAETMITVIVAGKASQLSVEGPEMIPTETGLATYTVTATDSAGNVSNDVADLGGKYIVAVRNKDAQVLGVDTNDFVIFNKNGVGTFQVLMPEDAVEGTQLSITVGYKDVTATIVVMYGETPMTSNMAPMAGDDVEDQMVYVGAMVEVQSNFSDPDEDMLSYMASSSDDMIATATVDDMGMVTITGVAEGMATITVTATDMDGAYAMQTIMVTVMAEGMPTDGEMLTSPSGVDAASLPGTGAVSVSWTPGQNATQHWVVLFSLPGYDVGGRVEVLNDPDANFQVFKNVPNGEYEVVVASYDPDTGFQYQDGIGMVTVE